MESTPLDNEHPSEFVDECTTATALNVFAAVNLREVAAVLLWAIAADLLIFRTFGYSGPALFFVLVPLLFLVNHCRRPRAATILLSWLLLCVSVRLVWLGSPLTIASGVVLVVALAMAAAGVMPYVLEGIVFASRLLFDGLTRLRQYHLPRRDVSTPVDGSKPSIRSYWTWTLPLVFGLVFASLFVMANPDLRSLVSGQITKVTYRIYAWALMSSPWELPFCVLALLIGAGLMQPRIHFLEFGRGDAIEVASESESAALLPAFFNTLLLLIVLFVAYLSFEFYTLWRTEFPEGFYYAGYAHQGAAWLTIALAVATALLSYIFSGHVLRDPRIGRVRILAWIWSALNVLLALAVYNRLMIYVGYNGMTQMRTVGFFGITVVVIGFALVVYKIARRRSFWWLVRTQMIALVFTVVAYSLFPVDYIAHRYNAAKVASGYLHPSVMIAVKSIDDEGMLAIVELCDHPDLIIREGVKARLADRLDEIRKRRTDHPPANWTAYQGSESRLLEKLEANSDVFRLYIGKPVVRRATGQVFIDYAMQWY